MLREGSKEIYFPSPQVANSFAVWQNPCGREITKEDLVFSWKKAKTFFLTDSF